MVVIISDKKQSEYADFVAETLEMLSEHKIKGLAVVALCESGENLTGYWNMSLRDKATAETEIRYDVVDGLIMANRDRYFEEFEEET